MVAKAFSVYDSKAEAYMTPFFMTTKGQAIRAFTDAVNSEGKDFCKYPADYTLFEIGSYDDSVGVMTTHQSKVNLGNALEFKVPDRQLPLPGAVSLNGDAASGQRPPNRAERRLAQ